LTIKQTLPRGASTCSGKKSSVSFSVFPFPNGIIARSLISSRAARLNITQAERRCSNRTIKPGVAATEFLASLILRDAKKVPLAFPIDPIESASRLDRRSRSGGLFQGRPETSVNRAFDIPAISRQLFARESADHVPMLKRV